MTTALSGIKPTGTLHLGNYLGMIRPALALAQRSERALYFIADHHALNQLRDAVALRRLTLDVAATLLALGLDPARTLLYRQSDVPETFELATILAAVTPKGVANRAHAYKAAVAANESAGRPADDGVNLGLYTYPILMAADILVMEAGVVPVGRDQVQHVEIARDVAAAFNGLFGQTLRPPAASIDPAVEVIAGLDGRKMSKSYGNVIPMFASGAELRRLVARIRTDSRRPEEPKDAERCLVFALYRQFATVAEREAMRARYAAGGLAYAEAKACLADAIDRELGLARARYQELRPDEDGLQRALGEGAARARAVASPTLARVRRAIGTGPRLSLTTAAL
ncbi:MAG TPA: tryptophan--tRNA ligase [Candidatus Dormibacteraeota bacterium]|nr:tryptophan--tRNA ligase [Candidatus Dormibacteraeota bacterium]